MPIRFRCAYCKQLMGISRRKAGTIVRCPRCAGEVIVPATPEAPAANGFGDLNPLLESEDFGKELEIEPIASDSLDAMVLASHGPLTEPEFRVQAEPHPSSEGSFPRDLRRRGLFLTLPVIVIGAVLLLVALGLAFVLGFCLGRATVP